MMLIEMETSIEATFSILLYGLLNHKTTDWSTKTTTNNKDSSLQQQVMRKQEATKGQGKKAW